MSTPHSLDSESRSYILESFQWPEGTTTLTWSFADKFIPSDGERDDIFGLEMAEGDRDIVREAFDAWAAVSGITFVEVADSSAANIRVGWQPYADSDGVGDTLAVTTTWFFDSLTNEVGIVFDPEEPWNDELFYDAALHEIGHAMGLDHSDVPNAVMSGLPATPYADQIGRDELTPDDIAAAQAIYGAHYQATSGNDTIEGSAGADRIEGLGGDDVLVGNLGNDTLLGGAGNDFIVGDFLDINATQGGNDIIYGGAGNDLLTGGPGDDLIAGQAGNDNLSGDAGNDRLWGGGGDDDILGGTGNDLLGGSTGHDFLAGQAGDDTLAGQAGDDILGGGAGNDRLWGGGGNDTLLGNEGRDLLVAHHGDDFLSGGDGNDTLAGQEGNDLMGGDAGNDKLYGGLGNDGLVGGEGNDTLYGFAGDDRLYGGEGNDFLSGDAGNDVFIFGAGSGHDTIRDFTDGEDVIDISALPTPTVAQDVYYYDVADGVLVDLAEIGGGTILLRGFDIDDVDASDFLF